MKTMKWFLSLKMMVAIMAASLFLLNTASAVTFTYNYSGGGYTVSALLNATLLGSGEYQADSGTFIMTSPVNGESGSGTLIAGGPGRTTSPGGAFWYDNLLYPASTTSFLDVYGLLFKIGNKEWNIWGNSGGPSSYSLWGWNGGSYTAVSDAGTLSAVPLPPALLLFASGLLGLGLLGRRKARAGISGPPRTQQS